MLYLSLISIAVIFLLHFLTPSRYERAVSKAMRQWKRDGGNQPERFPHLYDNGEIKWRLANGTIVR